MIKPIANIIFEEELFKHDKVEYINYYNGLNDNIDYNLPTLFVGWNYLKNNYNKEHSINILNKKIIKDRLYWEFSFKENNQQHITGVEEFVKEAPNFYFKPEYIFTNLDPVMFSISDIDDLFYLLPKEINSIYQYNGHMIYLLFENKIISIDLDMYEYFEFDTNTIVEKLKIKTKNYFSDSDKLLYQKFYKNFPYFEDLKRYIVVMLSNS